MLTAGLPGQKSVSGPRSARCSSERSKTLFAFATDKEIAVRVHVERPVHGPGWNTDRSLPGDPAVGGALN